MNDPYHCAFFVTFLIDSEVGKGGFPSETDRSSKISSRMILCYVIVRDYITGRRNKKRSRIRQKSLKGPRNRVDIQNTTFRSHAVGLQVRLLISYHFDGLNRCIRLKSFVFRIDRGSLDERLTR